MKKVLFVMIVLFFLSIVFCKNFEKNFEVLELEDNNMIKLLSNKILLYIGEYFYFKDGVVLKGFYFIYVVIMDDMVKELGERIVFIKKEEYDMVFVVVKGVVEVNFVYVWGEKVWE